MNVFSRLVVDKRKIGEDVDAEKLRENVKRSILHKTVEWFKSEVELKEEIENDNETVYRIDYYVLNETDYKVIQTYLNGIKEVCHDLPIVHAEIILNALAEINATILRQPDCFTKILEQQKEEGIF